MSTGGFGYDPLFFLPGLDQTMADLDINVKFSISHRRFAFADLLARLVIWRHSPMKSPEPPSAEPRIYWMLSPRLGIFYWFFGVMMFAGDWWSILSGTRSATIHDVIFPSLYLLLAGLATLIAYRTFIRLSADAIEARHLWSSQVLPFDKIKGRRRYTEKADPYGPPPRHLVLEPNDDRFPRIDLKEAREFDESFYQWFDSLPDLDKLDGIEEPKSKYANFRLV